jgi:quercetin dioxygenase-like cupin family protein
VVECGQTVAVLEFIVPDIRQDFTEAVCVSPEQFDWVMSPQAGVERVMLDRHGDEVAIATSLVRYAPRSQFPAHSHPMGEEYLVLEGEFADEHGRYGPGTYVRNPPGSSHAPYSDPGCVIWVKLRQFHPEDDRQVVVDTGQVRSGGGVASRLLHEFDGERVTVMAAPAGTFLPLPAADVVQELLLLRGEIDWHRQRLCPWGWLRVPAGQAIELLVAEDARWLHKTRPPFALP